MLYYDVKRKIMPSSPNNYYREQMQELINTQWDNTTMLQTIEEESPFASFQFREVEVRMIHALDKSTRAKQGDDFRELIFKNIDYLVNLGAYYKFDNAYWLAINIDELNRTTKNIIVRRCNNVLKWKSIDDVVHSHPCVLEYDATASSPRVDNNVITPNNRIRIIVQANEETLSLKVNHRFIFGGRPFKIIGYNNYMIDTIDGVQNIMYIQTQLDEISPYDDFVNNIAYNYSIIEDELSEDEEYIETSSDDLMTAAIVEDGDITYLSLVANVSSLHNRIIINPAFNYVRQNYTVTFTAFLYIDGVQQEDEVDVIAVGAPDWAYEFEVLGNNTFQLKCKKISQVPLELVFTSRDVTKSLLVDLKSMF